MANLIENGRSNTFKVKDEAAFKAALEGLDVLIHTNDLGITLTTGEDDGGWPTYNVDTDEEIDFLKVLAPHLADGEVAVLMTAGWERQRYVFGHAAAITNAGEPITISTEDIYAAAFAKFGVKPDIAG